MNLMTRKKEEKYFSRQGLKVEISYLQASSLEVAYSQVFKVTSEVRVSHSEVNAI